jgi:hypothetical protein
VSALPAGVRAELERLVATPDVAPLGSRERAPTATIEAERNRPRAGRTAGGMAQGE